MDSTNAQFQQQNQQNQVKHPNSVMLTEINQAYKDQQQINSNRGANPLKRTNTYPLKIGKKFNRNNNVSVTFGLQPQPESQQQIVTPKVLKVSQRSTGALRLDPSDLYDPEKLSQRTFNGDSKRSIRHDLNREIFSSEGAIGGDFSKKAASTAYELYQKFQMHIFKAKKKQSRKTYIEDELVTYGNNFDVRQHKNMLLILSGLALVDGLNQIYDICNKLLQEKSMGDIIVVSRRTDKNMRKFLNLILQSAVLVCDSQKAKLILEWGRKNTMLLYLTDEWIQVALKVTEPDGPGKGDHTLLKVLMIKQVVIKPVFNQPVLNGKEKKKQRPSLIKVMQQTANLTIGRQKKARNRQQYPKSQDYSSIIAVDQIDSNKQTEDQGREHSVLQATQSKQKQSHDRRGHASKNIPDESEFDNRIESTPGNDEDFSVFGDEQHKICFPSSRLQDQQYISAPIPEEVPHPNNVSEIPDEIILSNSPAYMKHSFVAANDDSKFVSVPMSVISNDSELSEESCIEKAPSYRSMNSLQNAGTFLMNDFLSKTQKKEKYLKLNDLIEILLQNVENKHQSASDVVKVFVEVFDEADKNDQERCVQLLFDKDKEEILFDTISQLEKRGTSKARLDSMIIFMHIECCQRQWIHLAMRIIAYHKELILSNDDKVLMPLLQSLIESPYFMDNKFQMLKLFLPKIKFIYVDILVTNLQMLVDNAASENGILVTNVNPFLVASTILYVCYRIKLNYPLAKLRIQQFEGQLVDRMIMLLDNVYDPGKVRKMLKQTDIENYSTLDLMGKLKMYKAMQTKVADRIIQDTWISKVDVSGSILENSTAFDYIKYGRLDGENDFESKKRLYHHRNLEEVRPNGFAYRVWFQSMNLRYFIEMAFFVIQVLIFQYYITQFNRDLHLLEYDLDHLIELGVIESDQDGRILKSLEEGFEGRYTAEQIDDIEATKEHLAMELELAVFELDEAMFVAMISFTFPLQLIMAYIYSRYTHRNFVMRSTSYVDLAIFSCVLVWFEKYEEYLHDDNNGFNLEDPPHEYHRFMWRLHNDVATGDFHFDWLLAITAFLFWIRIIFMLQLTGLFGPLIRTTSEMMKDLLTFFLLFVIQLIAFSCVGILSFGKLKSYETLQDTLIMFFQSSLGDWYFEQYDELGPDKKYYGLCFHIIVICVNMLLLLNLIIAIMSDTYRIFAEVKLGLYFQGIIESIPSYKSDKRYGGLVMMTPPFNVIAWILLPFYHCIQNKKKLQNFNTTVCKTVYVPIAVFFTIIFFIQCLVLTPIAWVKVVLHKILLGRRSGKGTYYLQSILYFVFGLLILTLTAIVDSFWFFIHLFQWDRTIAKDAYLYPKISLKAFNKFYYTVNKRTGMTCNAKELVLECRDLFRTTECIFGVLYANKTSLIEEQQEEEIVKSDRSLNTKLEASGKIGTQRRASVTITRQQQEKITEGIDYNLRGINTYNLLKRVIYSCVTYRPNDELDEHCEVNLPLLKGLLNEIYSEVYVSDIYAKKNNDDPTYSKHLDINEYEGYNIYGEITDHDQILKQVSQLALIDPHTIMEAFGIEPSKTPDKNEKRVQNFRPQLYTPMSALQAADKQASKQISTTSGPIVSEADPDFESSQRQSQDSKSLSIQLLYDIKAMLLSKANQKHSNSSGNK